MHSKDMHAEDFSLINFSVYKVVWNACPPVQAKASSIDQHNSKFSVAVKKCPPTPKTTLKTGEFIHKYNTIPLGMNRYKVCESLLIIVIKNNSRQFLKIHSQQKKKKNYWIWIYLCPKTKFIFHISFLCFFAILKSIAKTKDFSSRFKSVS